VSESVSGANPLEKKQAHSQAEALPVAAKKLTEMPLPDLKDRLGFSTDGLATDDAGGRLSQHGYNELPEKKVNPVLKFLSYFWGPIPWMIEVAAVLSAIVGHWEDFAIILALLVVNSVIGFWEEFQAGNTIAALKAKLAVNARVRRDAKWTMLPARELVPGDLIRLRGGDIIPADARLLSVRETTPISAEPHSWSKRRTLVAISRKPYCTSVITSSSWLWSS
jgi:H+-transporting ATPase